MGQGPDLAGFVQAQFPRPGTTRPAPGLLTRELVIMAQIPGNEGSTLVPARFID